MPVTYQFRCQKCKQSFDRRVPVGVRVSTCDCGGMAYYEFVPGAAIRIPMAFATNREDVAPDEPVRAHWALGAVKGDKRKETGDR